MERKIAAIYVPIEELKEWEDNPRINDEAVEKVAASIKRFGFGAPVVARKETKVIIAGHTRLKAAKMLGMKSVPCRYLDISETEAKALALADNKLGEIAIWDNDVLTSVLENLFDNNTELFNNTGFSEDELQDLILNDEEAQITPSFGNDEDNSKFESYNDGLIDFKFGEYKGLISPKTFESFKKKYMEILRNTPDLMLEEILALIFSA